MKADHVQCARVEQKVTAEIQHRFCVYIGQRLPDRANLRAVASTLALHAAQLRA